MILLRIRAHIIKLSFNRPVFLKRKSVQLQFSFLTRMKEGNVLIEGHSLNNLRNPIRNNGDDGLSGCDNPSNGMGCQSLNHSIDRAVKPFQLGSSARFSIFSLQNTDHTFLFNNLTQDGSLPIAMLGGLGGCFAVLAASIICSVYLTWRMQGVIIYSLKKWVWIIILGIIFLLLLCLKSSWPVHVILYGGFLIGYGFLLSFLRIVTLPR